MNSRAAHYDITSPGSVPTGIWTAFSSELIKIARTCLNCWQKASWHMVRNTLGFVSKASVGIFHLDSMFGVSRE